MAQDAFAGPHTVKKLDKIEAYLKAFLGAFKNQSWAQTVYFDAFAGTGQVPVSGQELTLPLGEEDRAFIVGSVGRALRLEQKFKEYIFVEKSRAKAKELEHLLQTEHAEIFAKIRIEPSDANEALQNFCKQKGWQKRRAVVFLDPFGSQVSWKTLEVIAETNAIDLWYLFPAGMSVHRQIGRDGSVHYTHEASLDRLFGTGDWRQAFISHEEAEPDLFGVSQKLNVKTATPESVTKFMIQRMQTIFKGGVLDDWLPLGSAKHHMYSLVFACANPSPSANKLALKLARAVLRSGKPHGRTK